MAEVARSNVVKIRVYKPRGMLVTSVLTLRAYFVYRGHFVSSNRLLSGGRPTKARNMFSMHDFCLARAFTIASPFGVLGIFM